MSDTNRFLGPGATGDIDNPGHVPSRDGSETVQPTDPETPPANRPEPAENKETTDGPTDR